MRCGILILGAGPAAAVTALGLQRLGHEVCVVAMERPFGAVEGVSERVVEALHAAGLRAFEASLPEASARTVTWNGVTSAANRERLIRRADFDRSLWHDLGRHGVTRVRGRVHSCTACECGFVAEVVTDKGLLRIESRFLVEARGRMAPVAGVARVRGPETVAVVHDRRGPPGAPHSAVQSHADGWAWMASDRDGRRYLQLTFDAREHRLPPKHALRAFCEARLAQLERARPFLEDSEPGELLHARTSTPILCREPAGRDWIRIGDAAMAVDPLSGNGIFQALSSAMQAPAVVNTLLRRPEHAERAIRFHRERVVGLFQRFARVGRDFCVMEGQWPDRPFWSRRAGWPDAAPAHPAVTPADVRIASMPVVRAGFIDEAEVVVTPADPLGVWQLGGHAVAPLLRAARGASSSPLNAIERVLGRDAFQAPEYHAWMQARGWIGSPGA